MTGAEVVRLPAASRANVLQCNRLGSRESCLDDGSDRLKNAASTNTYIVVDAFDVPHEGKPIAERGFWCLLSLLVRCSSHKIPRRVPLEGFDFHSSWSRCAQRD
jgi:hypothetical protein